MYVEDKLDPKPRFPDPDLGSEDLNSRIRDPGIPDPYPGWPDWPGCLGGLESGQSGLPEREARHGQVGKNRGWALHPLRLPPMKLRFNEQ